MALEKGYYLSNNLTKATVLAIFPPSASGSNSSQVTTTKCPFHLPEASYYVFHPLSDFADRYYYLTSTRMNISLALMGYWPSDSIFHTFMPGWYTLVCGDEWGQLVILHLLFENHWQSFFWKGELKISNLS
ncbi:MAG TPA: hypothetical protein VJN71_03305 [Nitrososphaerales archaeon]|nr:hypothetical protein [Nitrososphaerales archaeon]